MDRTSRPRPTTFAAAALSLAFALLFPTAARPDGRTDTPRFRIEVPPHVLAGVPVERVTITALQPDGTTDEGFEGSPEVRGLRWRVRGTDAPLPAFERGRLELVTDLAADRKVYITDSSITVAADDAPADSLDVRRIPRWFSIVPPVLAIVLAIWLRNVIVALLAAVYCGAVILAHGNLFDGFVRTMDTYLLDQIVGDKDHALIILFTLFLGAMIGVMAGSGGTTALVNSLARFSQTREHGQILTWFMGLFIFFDDYANSLLVGSTMRPVTDRLRVSREKLSFIVDSTAAPVAGLAIISTWVGVEVGYIADTYAQIYRDSAVQWDGYGTFLATIVYRFYPIYLLVFVFLIGYTGRDFGAMLRAETRALADGHVSRPDALVRTPADDELGGRARRLLLRNALVPISVLLGLILIGLWWTGSESLAAQNTILREAGQEEIPMTLWSLLSQASSNQVLYLASFTASVVAVVMAVGSRSLTLRESTDAWLSGAKSMSLAILILVLAWAIAALSDSSRLNTAGFLVELTRGQIAAAWMPSLAFVLAGAVAFATGTSWATMGLLMPLFISITHYMLVDMGEAGPNHPLMLATIGGILAGAIFGDHISPISDTTVLSSAASSCDHLDHVTTQLPYAMTIGGVSLLFGYLPVGFGYSPALLLPAGMIATLLILRFVGRRAADVAGELQGGEMKPPPEEALP